MSGRKPEIKLVGNVVFTKEEQASNRRQCLWAAVIVLIGLVVLVSRLFYLQIMEGEAFVERSEKNRLRTIRLVPPRGDIHDRRGRLIVGTRPCFDVCLHREETRDIEGLIRELIPVLGESETDLRTSLAQGSRLPAYMPIVLKRDVDWETLSRVEARLHLLPGVSIEISPGRYFPQGPVAPHLIGYLGEVTPDDLKSGRFPGVYPGDLVGKYGVEARWNADLAGKAGKKMVEVDADGRFMKFLGEEPAIRGNDLFLSIDLDLQQAAEEALAGQVGAIVALDPATGAIRALVSAPGFDPSEIAGRITPEEWKALNDPIMKPLFNRAIQGGYAPGSTFKIVMAAAGLEEGLVNEHSSTYCSSSFRFGNRSYRCWNQHGHGSVDLYKSLVESCDVYYYQLGLRLGVDRIAQYAKAFGLGSPTGIDISGEQGGIIATSAWKKQRFKDKWHEGETVSLAIGQGYTVVTPIQMARLVGAVANGGRLVTPHVLEKITDPEGRTVTSFLAGEEKAVPVSARNLGLVRDALKGVVEEPRGTGKSCRLPNATVAGKTGTAQVVAQAKRREDEKMAWRFRDHAWFVAVSPVEDPQLAVAVVVEHGGHGGSAAAPLAKKVFERWYQLQAPVPVPAVERSASIGHEDGHGA